MCGLSRTKRKGQNVGGTLDSHDSLDGARRKLITNPFSNEHIPS
jgi:hypothetical protein